MRIETNNKIWFSTTYRINYINKTREMIKVTMTQNNTFNVIKNHSKNICIINYAIFTYTRIKEK